MAKGVAPGDKLVAVSTIMRGVAEMDSKAKLICLDAIASFRASWKRPELPI
jgi:hypothetical protein